MASDDRDFEAKAADVIGLYLAPQQHAAVFCIDEQTAIQALDRQAPGNAGLLRVGLNQLPHDFIRLSIRP